MSHPAIAAIHIQGERPMLSIRWGRVAPSVLTRTTRPRAWWRTSARSGGDVDSISIIFDEGQDLSGSPDQFGLVILDNINVNAKRIGRGQ
jgi:hypothetical protein